MPMVRSGFVHQGHLDAQIKNAIGKLGSEAVHVAYNLGADSTGEPSIFFRIVLADTATREDTLTEVTGRIADILFDEVRPIENWDCTPISTFAASPNSEDGMIPSGIRWHTMMIFLAKHCNLFMLYPRHKQAFDGLSQPPITPSSLPDL